MQDLERTEKDQNPRERRQKKQTSVFSVGFSKNLEISRKRGTIVLKNP
jgi:hypothetical protein